MELRREEIARSLVLQGKAGVGEKLPAAIVDRDREPVFQESARAVPGVEAFECLCPESKRRETLVIRIERLQGEGKGLVLGRQYLFRCRRDFGGKVWRFSRSGGYLGLRLPLFLHEAQLEPVIDLQGRSPYAHAFLLCDEIQDVPASLAAEAVPGVLYEVHLPGVVSLPHGYGHGRPGVRLRLAAQHAGASANDVTDERFFDELTGNAGLNGVPVSVEALPAPVVVQFAC